MIDRRHFVGGATALLAAPAIAARSAPRFAAIVDAFAREHAFNGVVAHARGGRRDYLATFGHADVEARTPITAATRFAFGSASKWLTSVAVLRLVERGRLDLDRPITTYLPDFRADTGARLTLRRLLSNTSGLADAVSAAVKRDPSIRASTEGSAPILARYAQADLAFAPGTAWEYSFLNWIIVHAILERASGLTFAAALDRLVFAPLGMRGAGLVDTLGGRRTDTACAYATLSPPVRKMAGVPPFGGASGNVFASVDDAIRAAHGIFAGSLLSRASRAALTKIEWAPQDYALGGRVNMIAGQRWAWETGKIDGYRVMIAHQLEGDRTIVVFNNTDLAQAPIAALTEAMALA
jgi:D-alanyl-D-alanine carboxypeptidase